MTADRSPADRQEFERFVAAGRSRWVRAAAGILRDAAEAEDVVQDTLLLIWKKWPRHSLQNPEGYVSRAVTLNALKRRARRKKHLPLDLAGDPQAAAAGEEMDPADLERAIASLSPAQQAVVRTKFYVGLTFQEIGKNLSISSNTAASRCRYALAALRQSLKIHHRRNDHERE